MDSRKLIIVVEPNISEEEMERLKSMLIKFQEEGKLIFTHDDGDNKSEEDCELYIHPICQGKDFK